MNVLQRIFGVPKPLIAMCHLRALPGRPRHDVEGGMTAIYQALRRDVLALQDAGVDGLLFCNEHDIPYSPRVGVEVAAAEAAVVARLRLDLAVPFGVDVLWDPRAALAVARAVEGAFVREVFTGVFDTDMGLLAPDFGALAGYRHAIGADDVAIFTNVTPVLASTGTSPALSFAARRSARSIWAPACGPLISRASAPRNAAPRARSPTVRPATERLNSGVTLVNIATWSAPMACR